jgi:ankyrin repeat protein
MPSTFNTIAPELLFAIAEYLPLDALQALIRCNRFLYHLLLQSLYKRAIAAVPALRCKTMCYARFGMCGMSKGCPWMGDARQVALSLAAGLDVNRIVDCIDCTRLHIAARRLAKVQYCNIRHHSELEVLRLLLEHGADVHAKTRSGETPLHLLSRHTLADKTWNGKLEDACDPFKLLLRYGADVNAVNKEGRSPLHFAAMVSNHRVAALLLEHGADVDKASVYGDRPLMAAVWAENPDMVALLLEHGADVDETDAHGNTPLMEAVGIGNPKMVALLLENGADPHKTNDMRLNRRFYDCCPNTFSQVQGLLLSHGVHGPTYI